MKKRTRKVKARAKQGNSGKGKRTKEYTCRFCKRPINVKHQGLHEERCSKHPRFRSRPRRSIRPVSPFEAGAFAFAIGLGLDTGETPREMRPDEAEPVQVRIPFGNGVILTVSKDRG